MTGGPPPTVADEVVFVGRANIDLTVRVPHHPNSGQTVVGSEIETAAGGKSLNQAVAVARHGGNACLVANAGADQWGHHLKTTLAEAGVDTSHFQLLSGVSTGAAIVEVTPDGDNAIVLAISPRTELTAERVDHALARSEAPVVAVQLDMPPEPTIQALTDPQPRQARIGNLVPHCGLGHEVLSRLDVLVVNQHEAVTILGTPGTTSIDPLAAAQQLRQLGPTAAVVTAGPHGAAYSHPDRSEMISAARVPVVNTTGAGDAFLGSLALSLARHTPMAQAVARAVQAGTEAVQHTTAHLPT